MPARSGRTGRLKVAAQLSRMMPPLVGLLIGMSVVFFGRRLAAPIQCSSPRREAGDCSCLDQRLFERALSRLVEAMRWRPFEVSEAIGIAAASVAASPV